jgi:hypothetical protein
MIHGESPEVFSPAATPVLIRGESRRRGDWLIRRESPETFPFPVASVLIHDESRAHSVVAPLLLIRGESAVVSIHRARRGWARLVSVISAWAAPTGGHVVIHGESPSSKGIHS